MWGGIKMTFNDMRYQITKNKEELRTEITKVQGQVNKLANHNYDEFSKINRKLDLILSLLEKEPIFTDKN